MAFTRKTRAQLAPADAALVEPLLAAIDALNAEIEQLDVELETRARYPGTERPSQRRDWPRDFVGLQSAPQFLFIGTSRLVRSGARLNFNLR